MAERFELFRLSLLLKPNKDLFEGAEITREEYLRRVFSTDLSYVYNEVAYHYIAVAESRNASVVIGRIGRALTIEENKPPTEGLAETTREAWKAAIIVVDPTEHADGQKIAVEIDRLVANPSSLLLSLIRAINRANPFAIYSIEWAPIIEVDSFWEFAAKNKGNITSIRFDFVVPNMFGGSDSITEELRDFKRKEQAQRVAITLSSKEGLDVETEKTKEAVNYVSQSGGKILVKVRKGRSYTSTDKVVNGRIPDPDGGNEKMFTRISRFAKQILGRE